MLNLALVIAGLFSLLAKNHQRSVLGMLACLLLAALLWASEQAWWLLTAHLLIMVAGCGWLLWRGIR